MKIIFVFVLTFFLSACGKAENELDLPCVLAESSYIPNDYKLFTSASGFFLEYCSDASGKEEWEEFLDAVGKKEDAAIRVSYHCYGEGKEEEKWQNFTIFYQDETFILSYVENGEKKKNEYTELKAFLDESDRSIWFLMVEEDRNLDLDHCLRFDYYQQFSSRLRTGYYQKNSDEMRMVPLPKPWMVYFLDGE